MKTESNRSYAPVQRDEEHGIPAGQVPWELHAKAAEQYNKLGFDQSAERLAERHGFSWGELVTLLYRAGMRLDTYDRPTDHKGK
jgi:hypothetical protein